MDSIYHISMAHDRNIYSKQNKYDFIAQADIWHFLPDSS